jgi:hypothetical protein
MTQTRLTTKKLGNLDKVHVANIFKPTLSRINREKHTFCVLKSMEHLKKF